MFNNNKAVVLYDSLMELKKSGFEIIDSHMHAYDVMGVCDHSDSSDKNINTEYKTISLPESLKINSFSNLLLDVVFQWLPGMVHSSITDMYKTAGKKRLLQEMDYSGVDKGVLIPIEPWVSTKTIYENFDNSRFEILGSVNIHNNSVDEIKESLSRQLSMYNIKGVKLHPNLQGFLPIPEDNPTDLKDKLYAIYQFVEQNNLYLLFHAGYTRFTKRLNFENRALIEAASVRKNKNGLLKNFFSLDGKSPIFEKYKFPFVIAHMGNYGLKKPEFNLLNEIKNRYSNVFFDTSGVSPQIISKGLEIVGSDRAVFGSDAMYYNIKNSILFNLYAISLSKTEDGIEKTLMNIFGNNYKKILNYKNNL